MSEKKQRGVIDRIEAGVVVVVTPHPDDPDYHMELYVPEDKFTKTSPKEGEAVSVRVKNCKKSK